MPTTNDPYSRPINATKPSAVLVGEHYGERSQYSQRTAAAGNAAAASVAPYRGAPVVPAEFDIPKPKGKKGKPQDPVSLPLASDDASIGSPIADPVITEEDLFG